MCKWRSALLSLALLGLARPSVAQQRPLDTQDPETVGAGQVLIDGGISYAHDAFYPLSGLTGNLWQVPTVDISVGFSSMAEFQISGGPFDYLSIMSRQPAPLASLLTFTGDSTHAVDDIVIGMKIRLVAETPGRPAFGFRFDTRLPNAKHASGLGQDTTDFGASFLAAKTIASMRFVGNIGSTIMSEPLDPAKQNDVLTYGVSFARPIATQVEVVGELSGRKSTRNGGAPIGTESRGSLTFGGRYTTGALRFDVALFFGMTSFDPSIGLTAGFTYVFHAFTVP